MNQKQLPLRLEETQHSTIKKTPIEGLFVIERPVFPDDRGLFHEVYRKNELEEVIGYEFNVVQSNHTRSVPRVIRALHAEGWNKLVYPVNGSMIAVLVDIRPESATFGKYLTFEFSEEKKYGVFIPKGIANSICVTGHEAVDYIYLVDAYYTGKDTRAITWDDPDLAIHWPIHDPIISERDKNNPPLRTLFPEKFV